MEKAIGYSELNVNGKVIPLKCGMFAVEQLCEIFEVDLDTIGTLFKQVPNPLKKGTTMPMPLNPIRFMAVALLTGANYASRVSGGKPYDLMDAYGWIDAIGLQDNQITGYFQEFYYAVLTGKVKVGGFANEPEKKSQG